MKKIDVHVHAARARYPLQTGNPRDPLSHYVSEPDELRETLEKQGIGRAILMSGGESAAQKAHHLGAFNEDCRAICEQHGDFFHWMCNMDERNPGTLYDRLSLCKASGAVGIGEVMVNEWLNSPFLTELFGAAERLALPVLCHMSPEPGFSYGVCDRAGLPLLEETLKRFPKLVFIGHSQPFWIEMSGGCENLTREERNGFGRGAIQPGGRVEQLMSDYSNLYADLSAFSGSCAIMRDREYGISFLNRFQDRLLFGTDTTNRRTIFPLVRYLDDLLRDGCLSAEVYEKICSKNAQKLFGVQL